MLPKSPLLLFKILSYWRITITVKLTNNLTSTEILPPCSYNSVKQLLQTGSWLIFMKHKHRCKPSCIAKSTYALSEQMGTNSAHKCRRLPAQSPGLTSLSTELISRLRICCWMVASGREMAQSTGSTYWLICVDVSEYWSDFCNPGNNHHAGF